MTTTDIAAVFFTTNTQKNMMSALQKHPQIQWVIDALNRYEKHHVTLISRSCEKIRRAFIESLAQRLFGEAMPLVWRECQVIYFSSTCLSEPHKIRQDFQLLTEAAKQQRLVLVMDEFFYSHIQSIALQSEWRLIIFSSETNRLPSTLFTEGLFIEPDFSSLMALLKIHRTQLENFHRVMIADDRVTQAYTLAGHYLPGHSHVDKTLELLDSAASHVSLLERSENDQQKIPVTSEALLQVVSNWTHIPLTHLHHSQFQAQKLAEAVKKKIFGQDAAINRIAALLQNAGIKLQDSHGPLCNLLLAGSHNVGKTEMVYAIAEHLFGNPDAVLRLNPHPSHSTELMLFPRGSCHPTRLLDAIAQMPYAILLIEDIEQLSRNGLDQLKNLLDQGHMVDEKNQQYDFRHAIIIATTRTISSPASSEKHAEPTKAIDLMQLVLNQPISDTTHLNGALPSMQELCDELIPTLSETLPLSFLQKFNLIPFAPLDYAAFEKIIRAKIKLLARRLHTSFGIELSFAPEVVKFLAHEALWRKVNTQSLEKLLEQHLYSAVTHEILAHAENKDRSKRLLIQLNDSGQLLRCEFILSSEAALYTL